MRRRHLQGLDADILQHIEIETQENIDRGMPPSEARRAALLKFGNQTLVKEDTRAVWHPIWIEQLLQDLRYVLRMLGRSPGFTCVAVVTLLATAEGSADEQLTVIGGDFWNITFVCSAERCRARSWV